jgi:hypothetical protein
MSPTQYRTVVTSELREGDVVNCHGMRCLIDQPIQARECDGYGQTHVYSTQALVLNRDEVPAAAVPFSFTAEWYDREAQQWVNNGEHRWGIQGNDNAHWAVELVKATASC